MESNHDPSFCEPTLHLRGVRSKQADRRGAQEGGSAKVITGASPNLRNIYLEENRMSGDKNPYL